MKDDIRWQISLGAGLLGLSALLYYEHYQIFHDAHHIFIYLLGDIAFVFIEVLLVTLVLHQLLHRREKRAVLHKLNMVIGAFFSEVGTDLLRRFCAFDASAASVTRQLIVRSDWSARQFAQAYRACGEHACAIDCARGDLEGMRVFLKEKRSFLLDLLGNPNLLEHEKFTNLLWAVFHLTEELLQRRSLVSLPQADYQHLAGDIKRASQLLIQEWLLYMQHLQKSYPYLFSLAVRTNPFDPEAAVEVNR